MMSTQSYENRLKRKVQKLSGKTVTTTSFKTHPRMSDSNSALAHSHRIYEFIVDNLLLKPERNIKIGNREAINLSDDGLEQIIHSDQGYNSFLLLSHLAMHQPKSSVLAIGDPGTAKTQTPITLAQFVYGIREIAAKRAIIHGNPEITTSDILAYTDVGKLITQGIEVVHPRTFMKSMVRIIDEVNRIPDKKIAILYEVADKGEVTYKDKVIKAPAGPLFMTANFKDSGNSRLQRPFLDRVDLVLNATPLNPDYFRVLKEHTNHAVPPPINRNELARIQYDIGKVKWDIGAYSVFKHFLNEINSCDLGGKQVEDKVKGNAWYLKPGNACDECHYNSPKNICNQTAEGISTRMYCAIDKNARALSWFLGKETVDTETLSVIVPYALAHKLTPTKHAADPVYKNDVVSFFQDTWQKGGDSYEISVQKAPIIKDLPGIVLATYDHKQAINQNQVRKALEDISKLDSPSKFAYATALVDLMHRTK